MKDNQASRRPKRPGIEPPVRLKPERPGVDSEDEARTGAAEESIELMQAVEHPGEFPPRSPTRKRRPSRHA